MRANIVHVNNPRHAFLDKPKYGVISSIVDRNRNIFQYGNFENHPIRHPYKGRDTCQGDSGGPVMEFHLRGNRQDSAATLIGVHSFGFADCSNSKYLTSRRSFDDSYAGEGPDEAIWAVNVGSALPLGRYVSWIDEERRHTVANVTENPTDVFSSGDELENGPNFVKLQTGRYGPTLPPPEDKSESLLD